MQTYIRTCCLGPNGTAVALDFGMYVDLSAVAILLPSSSRLYVVAQQRNHFKDVLLYMTFIVSLTFWRVSGIHQLQHEQTPLLGQNSCYLQGSKNQLPLFGSTKFLLSFILVFSVKEYRPNVPSFIISYICIRKMYCTVLFYI